MSAEQKCGNCLWFIREVQYPGRKLKRDGGCVASIDTADNNGPMIACDASGFFAWLEVNEDHYCSFWKKTS